MTNVAPKTEVFAFKPPTPEQVDVLASISAISFVIGLLAFVAVIAAAITVVVKTKQPGRRTVLLSLVLLPIWWGLQRFMGGSLESVFGPPALLVTYTVYSAIAVLFSLGYLRLCIAFTRQRAME